jgi:nitrogenase molybdenum-iron protein NifN
VNTDPVNTVEREPLHATRNACKVCAPLGAAMVFKGVRGCLPFLHGSQGCATYIRRYMISHFREPVDIASSSFTEEDAIFGGARNFNAGLENVAQQYQPEVIGVATTCLSETIGENMIAMIRDYQKTQPEGSPPLVHVSTPAYSGTHSEGFHAAVLALVKHFAEPACPGLERSVNILPGMVSCADLRHLRELAAQFDLRATVLPDYADTLEGESWADYQRIPQGGTSTGEIATMGCAMGTVELGHVPTLLPASAGRWLSEKRGVTLFPCGLPIGVRASDALIASLAAISGTTTPRALLAERGRLVDAYVDAHKYVARRKVVIAADPDLAIALAAFVAECGMRPVIVASGAKVRGWDKLLAQEVEGGTADVHTMPGTDHNRLADACNATQPDIILGTSKCMGLARDLGIPLVRVGFPVHDRFGAQRQLTLGYRGTLSLFDTIVNALLEHVQDGSDVGYSYL